MAKARTGWGRLAPSTRARYERQGISRSDWESGVDLRAARGHAPSPPAGSAPVDATSRYVHGEGTESDYRDLVSWRQNDAPGWLPDRGWMADDTAAALSLLRGDPSQWRHVEFTPSTGDVWKMRVDYKRGYSEQIDVPSGSATEVLTMMSAAGKGQEALGELGVDEGDWEDYWEDWYEQEYDFDVGES